MRFAGHLVLIIAFHSECERKRRLLRDSGLRVVSIMIKGLRRLLRLVRRRASSCGVKKFANYRRFNESADYWGPLVRVIVDWMNRIAGIGTRSVPLGGCGFKKSADYGELF